jgi:DNA-directed RNA polymerase specialized sigma24 family protein
MHRRLAAYFDRKNCPAPHDLADETLSRVARRLEEEGAITGPSPARYCYIVARFVFLEHYRQAASSAALGDAEPACPSHTGDSVEGQGLLLTCLEQCLDKLDPDQRDLILQYYRGEGGIKIGLRRRLAARFGLTMNALSIRACRIRDRLEACVRACSGERRPDGFSQFRLI